MSRAYLKISVNSGTEETVRDKLQKIDEIVSADVTAGEQDIIAQVEASTYDDILHVVVVKIRTIDDVVKTVTNLVVE